MNNFPSPELLLAKRDELQAELIVQEIYKALLLDPHQAYINTTRYSSEAVNIAGRKIAELAEDGTTGGWVLRPASRFPGWLHVIPMSRNIAPPPLRFALYRDQSDQGPWDLLEGVSD
ncbi:hypothetical protein BH10CYA1_BH10CYA1_43580 [soil metagenome]